jgi:uncharacterized OsmC-like protein
MTEVTNGVNVQALLDAREVLKGAPDAAQFTWRASATWQNGVHSQVKVQSFFGLGEEQAHKVESVFQADHPEVFAATDNGITPIEFLIVGLASCLTAGVASVAENRGIQLNSVTSTVEGAHDIRGILGADSDVRNGFNDIKVTFNIDADASKEDIEALVAQSQKRSAVYDALTNPTNVTVEVAWGAGSSSALPRSSSARGTRASPRAASCPTGRSTTSCSSAVRWRTPGGPNAGTRCGCSRPTGRAACRAFATKARTRTGT